MLNKIAWDKFTEELKIKPEIKSSLKEIEKELEGLIVKSIKKQAPKQKFGILFSGGIDSTLIALILKKLKKDFTCYTAVLDDSNLKTPEDLIFAKKAAKKLNLKLKIIKIKLKDVEKYIKKIIPVIKDANVVKVGVALPIYIAIEQAKKDRCKAVFSGLGSEEIFAGYQRHRESSNINEECLKGIKMLYERDLSRDIPISKYHKVEIKLPFLDKELVKYSLKIPGKFKIVEGKEKYILRKVALNLGLSKEFAMRKKKAAQYGSNFHKGLAKSAKKRGFEFISGYLANFFPEKRIKLGALISSGKDSLYAMYLMKKKNYNIDCIISIKSKNPDSFMFHTPGIELVKLQANAMQIPLLMHQTKGEKEKELRDLEIALKNAKSQHKIEGIVTGALYSNYQKDRIEKICNKLGLKSFSPLWHIDQEKELREIIDSGFEFILTKIAAEGLSKEWLGKIISHKDVDRLVELNKKIGLNIAGEGGEFESLVLDCPMFKKKIEIENSEIKSENQNTAVMLIKKAKLVNK